MRPSSPRIPPLAPETWSPETRDDMAMLGGRDPQAVLNIFRTLAHHPKLAKRWMVFANHVLAKNTLGGRERELAILRIGWLCRSEYEWAQHVVIGLREGLRDDEIRRIPAGPAAPGWSEADRALLRATDELHGDACVSDTTWRALEGFLSRQQLMDLVFTVGEYALVSMALNSFGVPLDEGLPRMPESPDALVAPWLALTVQAPAIAAAGSRLLLGNDGAAIAFLATTGTDGAPRIAPVQPVLTRGELWLSVAPGSPKERDLARDPRFALHAAPGAEDEELQVSGRAFRVTDPAERAAVHAAARFVVDPGDPVFRLALGRALHVRWDQRGTPAMRSVRARWRAS